MAVELSPEQRGKGATPESLALLLKEEGYKPHYEGGWIPIDIINVLPQARRTFGDIEELGEDIADKGLMNPLIVARFNQEGCRRYLEVNNRLWQADLRIENLVSRTEKGEKFFYILIAGERRLQAFRYLDEEGCGKDHNGKKCFEYHFPNRLVEVRLCIDIPPLEAILRQASENIHVEVPSHEQARFYYNLYTLIREVNENYPRAAFARAVGRSENTIRNSIKFCELPLDIQRMVEQGAIVYGKALEIARLREADLDDDNLGWVIKLAMVQEQNVMDFRNWVTNYLRDLKSGQTMFVLFTEAQEKAMREASIRRVVGRNVIMAIWQRIGYFRLVISLLNEGRLGKKDSPFSIRSPVRVYLANINELERLLPLLRNHLTEEKAKRAEEILAEGKAVLEELEGYATEDAKEIDPYSGFFRQESQPPLS